MDLAKNWIPDQAGNDKDAKDGGKIAEGARKKLEKKLREINYF